MKATILLIAALLILWLTRSPTSDLNGITTGLTITELAVGMVQFSADIGRYPTAQEGLTALIRNDDIPQWNGPYLSRDKIPGDEWGNEFVYLNQDSYFKIRSLGKDGQTGTHDDLEYESVTSL